MDIGVIGVSKIPKSQFIKVHCIANLPTLSDLGAYYMSLYDLVAQVERKTKTKSKKTRHEEH